MHSQHLTLDQLPHHVKANVVNFEVNSPVSSTLIVNPIEYSDLYDLQIYNVSGAIIHKVEKASLRTNVELSNIPGGLYIIRIENSLSKELLWSGRIVKD